MENKKRIVLIDDNEDILDIYKQGLERAGFEVITAQNGKTGLVVILKEHPDLVLCDIIMPEADGFYVIEKMKKNNAIKNIPIFALTNLENEDDNEEATKLGVDDYLVKTNFTPQQLGIKIKNYFVDRLGEIQIN